LGLAKATGLAKAMSPVSAWGLVLVLVLGSVLACMWGSATGLAMGWVTGLAKDTDGHHKTPVLTRELSAPESASTKTPR
jgi:hypothetical protein